MARPLCRARGCTSPELYVAWIRTFALRAGHDPTAIPPMDDAHTASGVAVVPFVSRDEWMARCGAYPVCQGATGVCRDVLYMCPHCLNVLHGGQWLRVAWPAQDVQDEIDALLSERPFVDVRNYHPNFGDTIATLRDENDAAPWLARIR